MGQGWAHFRRPCNWETMPQPLKIWGQAHLILRLLLASIAWICFVLQKLYRHIHVKPRSWSQSYLQNIRKNISILKFWVHGTIAWILQKIWLPLFLQTSFLQVEKLRMEIWHIFGRMEILPKKYCILNLFLLFFKNGEIFKGIWRRNSTSQHKVWIS